MWKRADVIDGHEYRVGLKASEDGSRQFHLLDSDAPLDGYDFVTPIVDDHELLRWRRYEGIMSRYGTEGGTDIVVDAHGLWLGLICGLTIAAFLLVTRFSRLKAHIVK